MPKAISESSRGRARAKGAPERGTRRSRGNRAATEHHRVLLVEPHALVRAAAARYINGSPGLRVCGVAADFKEALKVAGRLRPHIVVAEMRSEDLGLMADLRRRHPWLPILVSTFQEKPAYRVWAAKCGASGYVLKWEGIETLLRNIHVLLQHWNGQGNGTGAAQRRPGVRGKGSREPQVQAGKPPETSASRQDRPQRCAWASEQIAEVGSAGG